MSVAETMLSAIRVPKTAEIVAGRIRKAIIRGQLKSGDRLPAEAQLIEDFNVSRPTLREAIRILESEGFIQVSRGAHGGARIVEPGPELLTKAAGLTLQLRGATLGDVYVARTLIEPPAARLAAELNSRGAARLLKAQIEREKAAGDRTVEQALLVADFHSILLDACGNVALGMVGRALHNAVERQSVLSYTRPNNWDTEKARKLVAAGHKSKERLVALIAAGDGRTAEAHWRLHLQETEKYWLYDISRTQLVDVLD